MRRKDKQQNLVLIAVFNKIQSNMRSMAIYNEEALPSSTSFHLGVAIKHLFKPGQSNIIVGPSRGR
jgi:hypothetical protein